MLIYTFMLALSASTTAAQSIPEPNFGFRLHRVGPKAFTSASPNVAGPKVLSLTRQKSSSLARHFWSHDAVNGTGPVNGTRPAKRNVRKCSISFYHESQLMSHRDMDYPFFPLPKAVCSSLPTYPLAIRRFKRPSTPEVLTPGLPPRTFGA